MVVPGGTPIVDVLGGWPLNELVPLVQRAASKGKPIAFIGTGSEPLRNDASKRLVADVLAPNVCAWSVRSDEDRDRLTGYGVDPGAITTAADLAWDLSPATSQFGQSYLRSLGVDGSSRLVGVNVNIEHFVRKAQPQLLEILAQYLDVLVERYCAHILFLCNEVRDGETFDLAASREVRNAMRHPQGSSIVPNEYWLPQQMMSLIACCDMTVSTRYHFCLFSALQGVPFVAVQRSSKVTDLCSDLAWGGGVAMADMSLDYLVALTERLQADRTRLEAQLGASVRRMRQRCERNVVALKALMERVRENQS